MLYVEAQVENVLFGSDGGAFGKVGKSDGRDIGASVGGAGYAVGQKDAAVVPKREIAVGDDHRVVVVETEVKRVPGARADVPRYVQPHDAAG